MPIQHVTRQPAKYNSIQWTGDNVQEIQDALNSNIFNVNSGFGQRLFVRDRFTNNTVAVATLNSWVISDSYYGVETNQFGGTLLVLEDADYQLQFITP